MLALAALKDVNFTDAQKDMITGLLGASATEEARRRMTKVSPPDPVH